MHVCFVFLGSDSLSISSHRSGDDSSDESEYSVDFSSMHEKSQSVRSSQVALATLDEVSAGQSLVRKE